MMLKQTLQNSELEQRLLAKTVALYLMLSPAIVAGDYQWKTS
jgi:hypothetical protein